MRGEMEMALSPEQKAWIRANYAGRNGITAHSVYVAMEWHCPYGVTGATKANIVYYLTHTLGATENKRTKPFSYSLVGVEPHDEEDDVPEENELMEVKPTRRRRRRTKIDPMRGPELKIVHDEYGNVRQVPVQPVQGDKDMDYGPVLSEDD